MNTYQAQQFWNDINGVIGFLTSIIVLGFLVGMVKPFSVEEPKQIWLVYVTPEGKWGAWDISPVKPTLAIHKEDPKKYLKEWGEYYYLDAEVQVQRGRFAKYWISEATTRYGAIRNVQIMALPEHRSIGMQPLILTPISPVEPHILDIAYKGRPLIGTITTKIVDNGLLVTQLAVDEPGIVNREFLISLTNALEVIAREKGLSSIKIEYLPQHFRMYELAGFAQSYEEGEAGMVVKYLERHSNESGFGRRSVRDVLENPRKDEYCVLVTRYYPIEFRRRALKLDETPIAEWDRDLAPSSELLGWWKEGLKTHERWEEYTRGFLEEVPPVLIREKAGVYKGRAQERKVVFVCEEEDWEYPYCHTWLLLNVLKEGSSNE